MIAMNLHRYPSTSGGIALGKMGVGARLSKQLPYDAEVEYMKFTGTQWIDTGVVGRFDTVVELDNEITGAQTVRGVFGSFLSADAHRSLFLYVAGNGNLQVGAAGNLSSPYLPFDTDRHLWQWAGNIVYKDGVEVFRSAATYETTPQTLLLGNLHNASGGVYNPAYQKIYRCRIGDVRDFIPVRVGTTGAMYDRRGVGGMNGDGSPRNDGMYYNRGTGDFVIGPDTNAPAI